MAFALGQELLGLIGLTTGVKVKRAISAFGTKGKEEREEKNRSGKRNRLFNGDSDEELTEKQNRQYYSIVANIQMNCCLKFLLFVSN